MVHLKKNADGKLTRVPVGHLALCPSEACPNGLPGINVTVTFVGGGTKVFLGEVWSSGQTKLICPQIYICSQSTVYLTYYSVTNTYGSERWQFRGSSVTPSTIDQGLLFLYASYENINFGFTTTIRNDNVDIRFSNDNTADEAHLELDKYSLNGFPTSLTITSVNIAAKWTTAGGLPLSGFIGNNQFGSITTGGVASGDVTITWVRANAADWNPCGMTPP